MLLLLPILRVLLLQPLTCLTGLCRENAVSTWASARSATSHSSVRARCSELAACCKREKPWLCCSRSESKIGLEKEVRWAGKVASCRGPSGSQNNPSGPHHHPVQGGLCLPALEDAVAEDSSGQFIAPFLLRNLHSDCPLFQKKPIPDEAWPF